MAGHEHGRGRSERAGARYRSRLALALALAVTFLVIQVTVAVAIDSLALLSDAGHVLTDAAGVGMALAAVTVASRPHGMRGARTFGLYRLEILAALVNAGLLSALAGYVIYAAIQRLGDPVAVPSTPMLIVGAIGLGLNITSYLLLRGGARTSLNLRAAALEVLADALGSAAVIVGGILIAITGWDWVDPVLALALGAFILPRTAKLAGQALRVLVEAAPPHVDLAGLHADLAGIPGVLDVHDLHVWTLTSDMEVATAHVMVEIGADSHAVLDQARVVLRDKHGVGHATLQVEPADHRGCDEIGW